MIAGFGASSSFTKKNKKSLSLMEPIDCERAYQHLTDHFENLDDPRGKQGVLHPFISRANARKMT
ncbi:MAG: hypothetical protein IGS23_24970 [Rivularia sp. T60_A2020_040]|nr:hypothetical protein [Rivularia sp. T60_A2020_040]MBF2016749.1 hypothetical protein [Rivularia sp. T60_A2020_040]MBF2018391.1 hypothetical protein [Rivularia sp. T60_A2020_040]